MLENVQFERWFFEKFSGGIAPRPPYWGGATAPLPRPHLPRRSGASRLPRLARDLRSLHRQAVIWDDFRHTNPEMLPAPLTPSPSPCDVIFEWPLTSTSSTFQSADVTIVIKLLSYVTIQPLYKERGHCAPVCHYVCLVVLVPYNGLTQMTEIRRKFKVGIEMSAKAHV